MLNFNGDLDFLYRIENFFYRHRYFFKWFWMVLWENLILFGVGLLQIYIFFYIYPLFLKFFRVYLLFFNLMFRFNFLKDKSVNSLELLNKLYLFINFQDDFFQFVHYIAADVHYQFCAYSIHILARIWAMFLILKKQKTYNTPFLEICRINHYEFGFGGSSFNHFYRRTQFMHNKFVTYIINSILKLLEHDFLIILGSMKLLIIFIRFLPLIMKIFFFFL